MRVVNGARAAKVRSIAKEKRGVVLCGRVSVAQTPNQSMLSAVQLRMGDGGADVAVGWRSSAITQGSLVLQSHSALPRRCSRIIRVPAGGSLCSFSADAPQGAARHQPSRHLWHHCVHVPDRRVRFALDSAEGDPPIDLVKYYVRTHARYLIRATTNLHAHCTPVCVS